MLQLMLFRIWMSFDKENMQLYYGENERHGMDSYYIKEIVMVDDDE